MKFNPDSSEILVVGLAVFLGFLGGIAKHFNNVLSQNEVLRWGVASMHGFIGGFTGGVVSFYFLSKDYDAYWILGASAIGGFAGAILLNTLLNFFYKHIGWDKNNEK